MEFSSAFFVSLLTLSILEIVLGVDNIVVISILSGKLPEHQQRLGRKLGISLALITRLLLLLSITWLMKLTKPLFIIFNTGISFKDLILLGGGLFLIYKGTHEIHNLVDDDNHHHEENIKKVTLTAVIVQIGLFDIVFSLDSVITAVGIGHNLVAMIGAIIIAMFVMLFAAEKISHFIEKHLSIKMLALSFLLLIGVTLVAEGVHFHIPKGYLYFAMAFSGFVETMTIIAKKKVKTA
jgi:predicted tellurium resistance membrane protein TerC